MKLAVRNHGLHLASTSHRLIARSEEHDRAIGLPSLQCLARELRELLVDIFVEQCSHNFQLGPIHDIRRAILELTVEVLCDIAGQ